MPRLSVALILGLALAGSSRADEDEYAHVSLREIRHNATSFKATKVAFKCRLNKTENLYAPFYTPFTPDRYGQVSVWGPESHVFREQDRLDLFPNIFGRRDAKWLPELLETPRYSWIYIWGEVVNDFNDQPWIEIHDMEVLSDKHYTDHSLGAAIRGYEAFEAGDMEGTLAELSRVSDYGLPKTDRFHVVKMKAKAAWALGRDEEAKRSAVRGLRIRPRDGELNAILEGVAPRALPEEGEKTEGEGEKKEGEGEGEGEKKEGEGEGEKKEGGSVDELRERVARLERENEKLRLELDAATEELSISKEMPLRVAGEGK